MPPSASLLYARNMYVLWGSSHHHCHHQPGTVPDLIDSIVNVRSIWSMCIFLRTCSKFSVPQPLHPHMMVAKHFELIAFRIAVHMLPSRKTVCTGFVHNIRKKCFINN